MFYSIQQNENIFFYSTQQVEQAEALQAELKHANVRLQRQSKIITSRSDDSIDLWRETPTSK